LTITLVTCECCRFEVPEHDIRGLDCCSECWNEVPAFDRLKCGRHDLFSDTSWEYLTERAEERRMERDTEEYYRQLDPYG
jgi:hypothetical protein